MEFSAGEVIEGLVGRIMKASLIGGHQWPEGVRFGFRRDASPEEVFGARKLGCRATDDIAPNLEQKMKCREYNTNLFYA